MLETIEESVPKFIKRGFNSLPKEIVDLIKFKKETQKSMKSTKSSSLKSLYNKLTSQVKISIKNYREGVWAKFIEKLGPHPVSSKVFWDKINQARSKKRAVSIPVLLKDSVEYKNDDDKVKIFSAMLGEIFSGKDNEYEFDLNHKTTVSPIPTVRQQPHGTNNQELASLNKCVQSNCECDVYTPTTGNRSDSPSKQLRNCSDCKHSWMLHCKKLTIE